MPQTGHLAWYTESPDVDPLHALKHLPETIGFDRAADVFRTIRTILAPDDEAEGDTLDIARSVLASELFRLYVPGTSLEVFPREAETASRMNDIITRLVAEEVRGDFTLHDSRFVIGKHFLYDYANERMIAIPTVTVEYWGYSSPEDWDEMQRFVAESTEIRAEKIRLEHFLGELKQVLYFCV